MRSRGAATAGVAFFWAARAELLARAGAPGEARRAYEIAIGLERDPAVRRFLQRRQSALPD
jgi:predicted RNA polymerase sigma factor